MEKENQNGAMPMGDRLIITGNLLGALSMAMISIGSILRMNEIPETPIFLNPTSTGATPHPKPAGINPNYWDR